MSRGGDLPEGTIVAGRYRVLRTAGSGGMGVVYVVEHVNTGGRAALKIMRGRATQRAVERFRREARASAIIQSEHVVRVTDADVAPELDDAPFLVMELLDGEDLSDRLAKVGRMGAQETVEILAQVARGLDRAHAAGVVHRDLKPQNIFLHQRENGAFVVKIVDFGISRIQHKSDGREVTGLTRAEDIFGTPSWMSPEQAMSMHHAVGPATDVWAVGLLAFKMLHGNSYWGDREAPQILTALLQPTRTAPTELDPTLPKAFDRWFLKSCSREPERRFQSALEQVESLAAALGVEGPRLGAAPALGTPSARESEREPTSTTGGLELTPPTGVSHPIAARAATAPPPDAHRDFGAEDDLEGPTAHTKASAHRDFGAEDDLEGPTKHGKKAGERRGPAERVEVESDAAAVLDSLDPPTTPRQAPLTRQMLTRTARLPSTFPAETAPAPVPSSVLTTSPAAASPLLAPSAAPRWSEAWAKHIVWAVPTLIFGGVFFGGLFWILSPDPPLPSAPASSHRAPAPAPTPSVSAIEPAPPVIEEPPTITPAGPNPRPKGKRPPAAPSPRRDAFDTQK